MNPSQSTAFSCLFGASLILSIAGCNLFSPLDKPSGDPQILSAARACLDRADYGCALDFYEKLSAESNDIKLVEEAYAILDQNGAGFGAYAVSFGANPKDIGK